VLKEPCILYPTLDLSDLLQLFLVESFKLRKVSLLLGIGILEIACLKECQPSLEKVLDSVHLSHAILNVLLLFGKAILQEIFEISYKFLLSF
jgi:hypothetical protein